MQYDFGMEYRPDWQWKPDGPPGALRPPMGPPTAGQSQAATVLQQQQYQAGNPALRKPIHHMTSTNMGKKSAYIVTSCWTIFVKLISGIYFYNDSFPLLGAMNNAGNNANGAYPMRGASAAGGAGGGPMGSAFSAVKQQQANNQQQSQQQPQTPSMKQKQPQGQQQPVNGRPQPGQQMPPPQGQQQQQQMGKANQDDKSWLMLCSALTDGPYSYI